MKVIKLWCHMKAGVKKIVYKIIFGKRLKIGKGTTWRHGFHIAIEGNGRVEIGDNCFFNNGCSVNSLQCISIGDGTIFGSNSHVYADTVIGKHCWIGTNVVILKGVHIGDNATIGAGVVVREDVEEGSVIY